MSGANPSPDVVVVGAGLAGLRAAGLLSRAGLAVALLEAGDRPGGRMATDVIDGFRCDRGFQVLNTSYPALRAVADLDALDLRAFEPGALVRGPDGRLHTFADPRRMPRRALATATDPLLGVRDKAALIGWTARVLAATPRRTAQRIDRTAAADLAAAGVSAAGVDRLLRPFLSGVLADRDLVTSAAFVRLVWRSFALGTVAVPAAGMGALPAQLAAALPAGVLRTDTPVRGLRAGATRVLVRTDSGELSTAAVVVATDAAAAAALLPGLVRASTPRTLTTYYHVPDTAPTDRPVLHLDGAGGPIANSVVLTDAAPTYAADGRTLVSSTVVGPAVAESTVRTELARLYGVATADWTLLHSVQVDAALPTLAPGRPLRSSVDLGGGLFVCGDHRDTPSTQGALVSGRRAAQAVLARRHGPRGAGAAA